MNRPTTSQIDAYCAALKAWGNGERVEQRMKGDPWQPFIGRWAAPDDSLWEFRVAPAPPKLREVYLHSRQIPCEFGNTASVEGRIIFASDSGAPESWIRFREVSETADAEIAEKLRNHDALCRAIRDYHNGIGCFQPTLLECMTKHEAHL